MKIKFLGASHTVTGSKFLLTTSKHQYLVDCGLFQGLKEEREKNWRKLEFDPAQIQAVFLTHAHIDHSGYIPKLMDLGFSGPIYCSMGTFELVRILLPDSGHLQEEEANYANKKGYSRHKPALPLYTRERAEQSLSLFKPVSFHKAIDVDSDVRATFSRAGHILGASCILLESSSKRIAFSGDVGRYNDLIMRPPEPLFDADYLLVESTYGDREHEDEDPISAIGKVIKEVVDNDGVILIPSFAVGRAQQMLYIVQRLKETKVIPPIKTYLDSPMAIDTTDLYCEYHDEHRLSAEMCHLICKDVIITRTAEESKKINEVKGPKIIISASGMLTGGRVIHHLSHYVSDPNNAVLIVGYQAAGTRGRSLLDGESQIKMFGKYFPVKAKVEYISGLSAHGDYRELLKWLKNSPIKNPEVFVVHGESNAAEAFADKLEESFKWRVKVPNYGDEFDL